MGVQLRSVAADDSDIEGAAGRAMSCGPGHHAAAAACPAELGAVRRQGSALRRSALSGKSRKKRASKPANYPNRLVQTTRHLLT